MNSIEKLRTSESFKNATNLGTELGLFLMDDGSFIWVGFRFLKTKSSNYVIYRFVECGPSGNDFKVNEVTQAYMENYKLSTKKHGIDRRTEYGYY